MPEKITKITFELENENKTSVLMKRDGKTIGRVYSQTSILPYPGNSDLDSCKNSVQICGFDDISEIWNCGVFKAKKDCVITFGTINTTYDKQQLKEYESYVKSFFNNTIKELKTGCSTFNTISSKSCLDLSLLKSFNDWRKHQL